MSSVKSNEGQDELLDRKGIYYFKMYITGIHASKDIVLLNKEVPSVIDTYMLERKLEIYSICWKLGGIW